MKRLLKSLYWTVSLVGLLLVAEELFHWARGRWGQTAGVQLAEPAAAVEFVGDDGHGTGVEDWNDI